MIYLLVVLCAGLTVAMLWFWDEKREACGEVRSLRRELGRLRQEEKNDAEARASFGAPCAFCSGSGRSEFQTETAFVELPETDRFKERKGEAV